MDDIDLIKRRLVREKAARVQAEAILEDKALALYNANNQLNDANSQLQHLNEHLEQEIRAKLAELQESEQRYRQLIESVQDIIYKISPEGIFIFVSPVVEKLLGYTEDEFVGKHFTQFVSPEYQPVLANFYLTMIEERQDSTYNEFPVLNKEGQPVWIGQTVRLIQTEGQVVEMVAVARDVSDRKLAEEELAKARHAAEEAQKAEKQFLANMSHEIRTPLNAIIGMSHLLFDTQPTRQQREYIDILKTSADFLHSLISDLLDMTKIEAGRVEVSPRPFDLAGLLRATQKVFEIKLHNRPVAIEVMLDARISGDFIGDDVMLNQILMNLIGNADKFTEEGSIQITAKIVQEDEIQSWIEFKVSDTGVGIPEDKQGLIFKKFRQVNPQGHKYKGTGLGLAITKELVEIQGGTIQVSSRMGQGSTFTFRLPYARALNSADARDNNLTLKTVSKLPVSHVMVVEDNLMNQTYIGSLLTKWKIPFTLASDGKKAVEQAKLQRFDMILMDIQMPIMDGYEATVAIRSTHNPNQHVPIIALTASAMLDHKSLAMEVGMNDFLTKPFEPTQLLNILERYAPSSAPVPAAVPEPVLPLKPEQKGSTNDAIDRQRLYDLYGTDTAHAAEMFAMFLNDVVPELHQLPALCEERNWSSLASMAHKLKPTLGMVGLSSLEDELRQIEKGLTQTDAQTHSAERCLALVERVNGLLPTLQTELETLTSRPTV